MSFSWQCCQEGILQQRLVDINVKQKSPKRMMEGGKKHCRLSHLSICVASVCFDISKKKTEIYT